MQTDAPCAASSAAIAWPMPTPGAGHEDALSRRAPHGYPAKGVRREAAHAGAAGEDRAGAAARGRAPRDGGRDVERARGRASPKQQLVTFVTGQLDSLLERARRGEWR